MSKYFGQLLDSSNNQLIAESADSGSGYQKCADGTLILWGGTGFEAMAPGANSNKDITFAVPFSSDDGYVVTLFNQYNYPTVIDAVATRLNRSSCRLYVVNRSSGTTGNILMGWIAIGRWK